MTDDAGLLRKYAETGAEDAFSELVRRHLPLVYAAALRQVFGSEAMAEDVAQTVFIDLARKAACLAGRDVLAGWLYSSTRLAAYKAMRGEHRRQRRERIAAASMREDNQYPPTEQAEIRPVLDEAMSKLSPRDRNALLLRFFESKDFKGVGAALGLSEDAARMRVTRALEKLTALMSKRGVTVSGGALGMVLATEATVATPPGLAASICAVATTSVSAGAATTALVKLLSVTKFKAALISAVLVAGIVAPVLVEHRTTSHLRAATQTLPAQTLHAGLPGAGAESTSENAPPARVAAGRSGLVERETRLAKFRAEGAQSPSHVGARANASAAQHEAAMSRIALLKAWLEKMPDKNIPEI
jgi:RNA polymerase sigma factor (sigma-70 family)